MFRKGQPDMVREKCECDELLNALKKLACCHLPHTINVIIMAEEEFFSLKIKKWEKRRKYGEKLLFHDLFVVYLLAQEILLSPLFSTTVKTHREKLKFYYLSLPPKHLPFCFPPKLTPKGINQLKDPTTNIGLLSGAWFRM